MGRHVRCSGFHWCLSTAMVPRTPRVSPTARNGQIASNAAANADSRVAAVAPNSSEMERIDAYEVTKPRAACIAVLNPANATANSKTYALLALREPVAESICEDYGSQRRIKATS